MTRSLRALFLPFFFAATTLNASITFNITHEHCSNASGQVSASVTGGVPPYTYSWSTGPTTSYLNSLVAGSYTLTVTDNVGAQQVNTAVVQNLSSWEWSSLNGMAAGFPSCDGTPGGYVFFGGDIPAYPQGPDPHEFDQICMDGTQLQPMPSDFDFSFSVVEAICYWAQPGTVYAVNYTDANGCPGYMEAVIPAPPQFYPVTVLDIEGSCSGGANGSVLLSSPPEQDFIPFAYPRLYNSQWQMVSAFGNLGTNWTGGWTYSVPGLAAGTYAFVRRLIYDPSYASQFPCGDTAYFTIPDLGPTCGNVSGTVAIDVNEDCLLQWADVEIPEMIVEFQPGPYYATTDQYGHYGINLPLGSYTVTQQTAVVDEHCLGDPIPLNVAGNMTFDLLDTATQALDIQLSMASGPARPGFDLYYAIDLDNLTSATGTPNQVVMNFDPALTFISATPNQSNVSGNTITWNNAGSLYYFYHSDITVRFQVPPNVGLIGTDLAASATLTLNPLDGNAANNSASMVTTVTGSYDPNEKVASTSSAWSHDLYYIDVDQWIDYTLRFQNTGTDTAFTVVVTDTLPATLDASTLVMGAGSHPFTWELEDAGTLKLMFVNILLPDSNVNEPASHGFASFRIRPKQPLLPGTVIENAANIFFDFNPAVITEESVLTAEFSTAVREPGEATVRISPNPAADQLSIVSTGGVIGTVRIKTIDGRTVITQRVSAAGVAMDVSHLATGTYLLEIIMPDGQRVSYSPFVKQ